MRKLTVSYTTLTKVLAEQTVMSMVSLDATRFEAGWTRDNFLANLLDKWQLSVLACDEQKQIVGFVIASRFCDSKVHIHRIAVDDKFGGKGVGKTLLAGVAERAVGCVEMILECPTTATVTGFYQTLGFARTSALQTQRYLEAKNKLAKRHHYLPLETCSRLVFAKSIHCTTKHLP